MLITSLIFKFEICTWDTDFYLESNGRSLPNLVVRGLLLFSGGLYVTNIGSLARVGGHRMVFIWPSKTDELVRVHISTSSTEIPYNK